MATAKKTAKKTATKAPVVSSPDCPAIYTSMAEVMRGMSAIGKEGVNKSQKFRFRGIDQVYNALHPLMAKHSVFTVPRVLEMIARVDRTTRSGGNITFSIIKVEYDFVSGIDGSKVTIGPVISEGADSGDKGLNKALAVGHKYVCLQTFLIPTEDMDDPDAEAVDIKPVSEAKPAAPKKETAKPPAAAAPDKSKIKISNEGEAAAIADMIINLAEGMTTIEGLKDYWIKNFDRTEYIKAHYPDEHKRITAAFSAHKATLTE